jgi:ABC-type sugar transport system ATPase subunit
MARVSFQHVGKRFGPVEAVHDLTLEVAEGELMVLVGPSGSGKTTALRMVAGLEAVTAGRVEIGGRVVNDVSPRDRDVAMVFQDYALYPQMTVYENMAFGLRRRGMPRREIERRVAAAGESLELGELLRRRPRELSGGQQQRVALGRALVREPQVFLMDEPLSNLDAQLRVQTRGEIKRLQQQVGTTTLYVTHDQVEAMTLGDRIAVMNRGRLEQVGPPHALYERPANAFVGGFIGSPAMSFAPLGDGGLALDLTPLGDGPPALDAAPPGALLGVRPEHVRVWEDGAGLIGPVEGRVAYVEALGRETLLGVDASANARLVAYVEGRTPVQPGETVRLGLVPEGVRLFAARDGAAL